MSTLKCLQNINVEMIFKNQGKWGVSGGQEQVLHLLSLHILFYIYYLI